MSQSSELSNPRLDHILHMLVEHRKLWLIPGCAALLVSWMYVYFVRSDTYTARQTLIVRDDLLGQSLKPGQFESLDLMKSAQETILEIARKPQVIRNALKTIGPARVGWFGVSDDWPNDKEIEEIQGSITLSAPNGAEFGQTETVVLGTKSASRERAAAFVLALLEEINIKINEVRDLRLHSMKNELTIIRDSARDSLSASAERLIEMEREIGPDLPTLRALSDPQAGDSSMSQTLLQIRSERRQFENKLHSARKQRETLLAATDDPNAILATSDELFSFQPSLSRLKQELIEAQSALAESIGRYEQAHPEVQKHQEQVRSMHTQIHEELDSAERGLESQIQSLEEKVAKSNQQEEEIDTRFNKISSKRVDYLRLDEEVKKKSEVFNEAQGHLASVQRLDSNEFAVTLLTPVDEPQVSTRADGLGKTTTILGSGIGGFLAGFGLVLLLAPGPEKERPSRQAPSPNPPSQAWTDAPVPPTVAQLEQQPVHTSVPSNVTGGNAGATANTSSAPTAAATKQESPQVDIIEATPAKPLPDTQPTSAVRTVPVEPEPVNRANSPLNPIARKIIDADGQQEINAKQKTENRAQSIQAEINRAVAASPAPDLTTKPAVSPLPRPVAVPTTHPQPASGQKPTATTAANPGQTAPTADANRTEFTQAMESARRQSDSTGVPTAASILAALNKVSPAAGKQPETVIQPQQAESTPTPAIQDTPIKPMQNASDYNALADTTNNLQAPLPTSPSPAAVRIQPSEPVQSSTSAELELHRRANQRPLDIAKQAAPATPSQAIPFVSTEPATPAASTQAANSEVEKSTSTNPFLNPSQSSSETPSATAQRMLEEGQAEAKSQGMVAPVSAVKPDAETALSGREPANTVPIPDQIKQLTDSIASFAKPITRVQDSVNKTDF